MSYDQFSTKYGSDLTLCSTLILSLTRKTVQRMVTPPILDKLCNPVKPNKYVYITFLSYSTQFTNHMIEKWQEEMSNSGGFKTVIYMTCGNHKRKDITTSVMNVIW